ncbi:efflux RND transporter permease subunit [Rapidithrix thailandica]|uniref:Efflux RND transporter permease subunit n=1 Tax=Rapidithrix thailandica TaxID=413964 RepID=A0AAW9SAQ0_9BACT
MINSLIRFFLENRLVTGLLFLFVIGWGIISAPFDLGIGFLPSDPVAVDAIPDIGENQQIVFTQWQGRSPQDIEDQVSYPLTTALLGIPGVKTIRSSSMFGLSSIYIIFEEGIEFYWSRSRILEKLNSLPSGLLPEGAQPALGPDATALGQIFWYTLEGRDKDGNPTGGWDLHELRTIQDYQVKFALMSSGGVSEIASIGGFVKEYQVDLDPNALKAHQVTLTQVVKGIKESNLDVGARTIEINNAEYFVRGLGYIQSLEDLEESVITVRNNTPIRIKDVGVVSLGPAERRGMLDKSGSEAVGGVVVARYGSNPLQVIQNVKEKIKEIEAGLPTKTLADGTVSQVKVIPFYDRTQLINETLGTLKEALTLEILITVIVIIVMVINLRASVLISGMLPLAVLMVFIAMKQFGVDANIVSLSGIAIAIGTIVDVGIVLSENMIKHLHQHKDKPVLTVVYEAAAEVSGAILTAVSTTIVSFIPVFALQGAEGKLFSPLAFTKTFALIAAVIIALVIIPSFAYWFFAKFPQKKSKKLSAYTKLLWNAVLVIGGAVLAFSSSMFLGFVLILAGLINAIQFFFPSLKNYTVWANSGMVILAVAYLLTYEWMPLGPAYSIWLNFLFVAIILVLVLGGFRVFQQFYPRILKLCLDYPKQFLLLPMSIVLLGMMIWQGFDKLFGWTAQGMEKAGVNIGSSSLYTALDETFPGIGKEFMPALDEGSFLLMPTSMPHAGIAQNKLVLQQLDMAVTAIPEVENVVGKLGRVESALDPAPISMYENVILYRSEYIVNDEGERKRFKTRQGQFLMLSDEGEELPILEGQEPYIDPARLIPDEDGEYFRQWREHIHSPDDIWQEIVKATKLPGVTSAPKLQPIETRLVMLQTGMRAPMGIKVKGPDLRTIEEFGLQLEAFLKEVPSVKAEAVFADRIVGKPYLEIEIDRNKAARYGLSIAQVQQVIETAIGGMPLSYTVEGRERYPVRVRYARELRDDPDKIRSILLPTPTNTQIPLGEIAKINYTQGPQMIKSEDTFLIGYVLLDKKAGYAEVDVVEEAQEYLNQKIENGELVVPAGVSYTFSGSYENQLRAEKRLSLIIPLCLVVIFLILYFQFKSVSTTMMVFSGILVAFSGGFILIWLYGQSWFMNIDLWGINLRNLFQINTVNLSVAVWVGFIALFGIATDDGVLYATYLNQSFEKNKPENIEQIKEAVLEGGNKRVRPALMTSATTILALLPVLTSTGRGADIMVPMAIPSFGGMLIALITLFVVPVLYYLKKRKGVQPSTIRDEK